MSAGALDGVRVIDFTQALAGPFCTSLLADYGADVIKIEPPHGDMLRNSGPFIEGDDVRHFGGVFQNANRNKRSLVLDLKSPAAREIVLRLATTADIVVENFSSGVMERLDLSYETLREVNPRLVYTSIRGFGDARGGQSPHLNWPAFDIVAQAMGGLMGITGTDADHPVRTGSGVGDTVPGIFAAFGTMVALFEAHRSGQGQYVDTAMVDAVLKISEVVVNNYAYTQQVPQPIGNRLRGFAPFDTVPVKDGKIALCAPHNAQWRKLCALMGREDLTTDPRFDTDHARWESREELYEILNAWTSQHTTAEITELLGGKVAIAPIYDAEDVFADPHFQVRQMLPLVEQPGTDREVAVTGVVPKLTRSTGQVRHRAPTLGEHSGAILREAGFDDADVADLIARGALGSAAAQPFTAS